MSNYLASAITSPKVTPQSEPIPGSTQVQNSEGGYAWAVDDWTRLERFLVLGTEGGTYYATERKLTRENIDSVKRCIITDAARTIQTIVSVSESGRAPKNDPALLALALCASFGGSIEIRQAALEVLPRVARIGTHLFHFAEFIDKLRGWGPSLRKAVAGWYLDRDVDSLAYQLVKYQSRDGWSHRDLIRLSHPKVGIKDSPVNAAICWALGNRPPLERVPLLMAAFDEAQTVDEKRLCALIGEHNLTHEMVPTQHLKSPAIWEALLEKMPLTAMVRSLGRMGACGLLAPMSDAAKTVCERLADTERIRRSRIHPIQVLTALLTYKSGRGQKGSLTWTSVPQVVDALDNAFYLAFENAPKTGKRFYLGIDVSGSMDWSVVAGVAGLTPRIAAGAMAMVTMRTEPQYYVAGFARGQGAVRGETRWSSMWTPVMKRLDISAHDRLDRVTEVMRAVPAGGTDCALPMLDALAQKMPVDVFTVYTDSVTWAGTIHPVQALRQYRDKMGIPAKLVVVGMVSNGFSIADPSDAGMLDVVGFDSAAPAVIADFACGGLRAGAEEEL